MPLLRFTNGKGLEERRGSGALFETDIVVTGTIRVASNVEDNSVVSADFNRGVSIGTQTGTGIYEQSGSTLILRGKDDPIFFHLGGNQYISNNAWYDSTEGQWRFATGSGNHSAFRWGWVSVGRFDLDYAKLATQEALCYFTRSLSLTASDGSIAIGGKTTDYSAQLDITGSYKSLALAVTGAVDIGGAAPDAYFMPPRLTTAQRDALSGKAGMLIYNSSTNKINFHNGTAWKVLSVDS